MTHEHYIKRIERKEKKTRSSQEYQSPALLGISHLLLELSHSQQGIFASAVPRTPSKI